MPQRPCSANASSSARTAETRFEEITNYFVGRRTSGFVEGLNNKIKVIKRRCYGMTSLKHLYQRVYLDLDGYARFGTARG
ncbi:transposase [Thiocapsa sp. UBA6158]|uniref:transposase n=1 Tax=Thiocapsa sp. UBA6158 TaxID=1947692 RepID=UPI0039C8D318